MEQDGLILSVHIPKTGGTSFRTVLKNVYGSGYLEDYEWLEQRPEWMKTRFAGMSGEDIRNALSGIRCIHGHYAPQKYTLLREVPGVDVRFVTWLRDPVERAVSMYHYMRTLNTPRAQQDDVRFVTWLRNPVERAVSMYHYMRTLNTPRAQQEPWEREAKALDILTYFRTTPFGWDAQSRLLGDLSIDQFSFVGITERYQESMAMFLRSFVSPDKTVEIPHELKNPGRAGRWYEIDDELRDLLVRQNQVDYALYRAGCAMFERSQLGSQPASGEVAARSLGET